MSVSLWPHGLQHTRLPCSSPAHIVYSNSWSIESVMPSNHLILCHPLLLPASIFPSIRVFSNESVLHIRWTKYWSFSFNISPSNECSGPISFRMDWLDLLAVHGTLKSQGEGSWSLFIIPNSVQGFPGGSVSKESTCSMGDLGWILGWEDPLEEGMETSSSVLTWRIPMDRGAWRATVLGVSESDTTERLTQHIPFYKWGDSSPGDNKSRMPLTATSLTHSVFPTRNISFKTISAYLF